MVAGLPYKGVASLSLRERAAAGVKWSGAETVAVTVLQFAQYAVLARLLSPDEFGLMAMLNVIVGFTMAFSDVGISNAIIHRQDATREQLSSLYWLSLAFGMLVFLIIVATSPLIAWFYKEPRLESLVFWVAISFIFLPVGKQFEVLLQKDLRFDRLIKAQVASVALGSIVAVVSAVLGQGVFSLIWGLLSQTAAKAILLVALGWSVWRPAFHFHRRDLKGYIGFGMYQMGERSVNYFSGRVDYLIIGRYLGAEVLGVYMLAYRLVVLPLTNINPIITRVAFPVFARKQKENTTLQRGYLEMTRLLGTVIFPICIGLGVTAPLVVPIVYGAGWEMAIPLTQILVIVGLLKALGNPSGSILLAKGRADIGFKWNVCVAAGNTAIFWWFVRYGVFAVAWSFVAASVVYTVGGFMILYHVIRLRWSAYLAVLARPAFFSGLMGAAVHAGSVWLTGLMASRTLLLLGLVAAGAAVYFALMALFERPYLREMASLLFARKEGAV